MPWFKAQVWPFWPLNGSGNANRHRNDQSLILSRIKIDNLSSGNIHGVEKASPSDDVGSQTCLGFWDIRVEIRLKGPR